MIINFVLTLSWRRPLLYRNQSIDLLRKSMDKSIYGNDLRHERVKHWSWQIETYFCRFHLFRKKKSKHALDILPEPLSAKKYKCWRQNHLRGRSKFLNYWIRLNSKLILESVLEKGIRLHDQIAFQKRKFAISYDPVNIHNRNFSECSSAV